MKETGKRRLYPEQFKKEALSLVTEHGYSIVQAAQVVDTSAKNLQRWVKQQSQERNGDRLNADERVELQHLRREVSAAHGERSSKKGQRHRSAGNEVKYGFIQARKSHYPVVMLCRVMGVSSSAYYDWRKKGAKLIDSQTWHLCQRIHTTIGDMTPVEFEKELNKVSGFI